MRRVSDACLATAAAVLIAHASVFASPPSEGSLASPRPTLVLAHYMPWFEAKPTSPRWGWHWTMNARDPELVHDGKHQIASHYYPLIGPYDSGDPTVIEYHLHLMRLAGIDGVIVDWYGLTNHADYALLHKNSCLLENAVAKAGMRFAVCYEDQTVRHLVDAGKLTPNERVAHVRHEIEWLAGNWFARPHYVRHRGKPLLLSFGYSGLDDQEWAAALASLNKPLAYASEHHRRACAAGAFDWPKPEQHPESLAAFHRSLPELDPAIPVAFPRFHDYRHDAKLPGAHRPIEDRAGRTWSDTLEMALLSHSPFVQIATWNDWGEGTGIEPTLEFGYRDLEALQSARRTHLDPRFPHTAKELRLPERLFRLRRTAREPASHSALDAVSRMLASGSTTEASATLDRLAAPDPQTRTLPNKP